MKYGTQFNSPQLVNTNQPKHATAENNQPLQAKRRNETNKHGASSSPRMSSCSGSRHASDGRPGIMQPRFNPALRNTLEATGETPRMKAPLFLSFVSRHSPECMCCFLPSLEAHEILRREKGKTEKSKDGRGNKVENTPGASHSDGEPSSRRRSDDGGKARACNVFCLGR